MTPEERRAVWIGLAQTLVVLVGWLGFWLTLGYWWMRSCA